MAKMPQHKRPLELLCRSHDPKVLLGFFRALEEEMVAATADAARVVPEASVPSAKQARGVLRRHYIERAARNAAARTGIEIGTGWNSLRNWSFPTILLGAFTLAIGIVSRPNLTAPQRLRTRSAYVAKLCSRNEPLNPQLSLFDEPVANLTTLIPDGAFGAMIVSEHSNNSPDIPTYLGVWIPSKDLRNKYHSYSFEEIFTYLRDNITTLKRPTRKAPVRKLPKLRKKPSTDAK
ncbi:hypothetical protein [Segnochrobactrum spirostomi]|uniref:Uncharacterized protein n=1 Tax=Segnochrobactrum spirostomi TaxID=2608987 RepID=A0A6A7Y9C4_9HYPH|nr:hypothetical protein [Segnochrobactrum spirostomi]MQT14608.1 hypothetical protein [Segnochrobactrum spirostomi]